jgi:Zinc knuckle
METRAKARVQPATIDELSTFAADASASILKPSHVAHARRESGLFLQKEADTRVEPKRWPTVITLREQDEERQRLLRQAKSPTQSDHSVSDPPARLLRTVGEENDAAAHGPLARSTPTAPRVSIPQLHSPAADVIRAATRARSSASAEDGEALLQQALKQIEALIKHNANLEQALDASRVHQQALLPRSLPKSTLPEQEFLQPVKHGNQHDLTVGVTQSAYNETRDNRTTTNSMSRDYKILKYAGDSHVETYLTQFQLTARAAGYPRSEWGYRLCAALEGKARGILTQDILDSDPSYEEIAALLYRRFASESSPALWQQQLEGRRRGDKESITDLQHSIRDATSKAFPNVDMSTRARLAAGYFISALADREQSRYVRTQAPSTLEDAARVALAYENALKIDEQRNPNAAAPRTSRQVRAVDEPAAGGRGRGRGSLLNVNVQTDVTEGASESSLVRAVTELVETLREGKHYVQTSGRGRGRGGQGGGRGRGRGWGISQSAGVAASTPARTLAAVGHHYTPDTCFTCGEEGHYARDCPHRRPQNVTCYRCGLLGHVARFCQSNQGNELGSGRTEQALSQGHQ